MTKRTFRLISATRTCSRVQYLTKIKACMVCYIDLTVDITKLPNYAKIKQISDQANVILRSADFGYGRKELFLRKTSGTNLTF